MVDRLEQLTQALADRYRIEGEIGAGGMATVFLAQDLKHDRRVAIKVLRPELAAAVGADRFLREIRTTANLSHPHILPLFDSGEADGFLYFVMPYVKGESLRDRLRREKQLPVEEALQITREIADALAYAHGEGVIHRDVKPANVMLEAGHALLADFGIAQAMASVEETRLTESGMSLGTPSYMSPEQVSGEEELDGRSDQYALACVLYEMLAGHPPFSGAAGAVLRQHLAVDPQPVDQVRTSVPVEVSEAISRGLAKSPADRFPTMEAFGEALAGEGRTVWTPSSLGRARAVIFGGTFVLALAAAATVASLWPRGNTNVDPNLVAVTPFENRTGDPSLDYVGDYAAEMVRHAIEGGFIAEVLPMTVAERVLDSAGEGTDAVTALAEVVGVGTVVTGSVYRMGDSIRIGADCIDTRRGRSLFAVPPVSGTVDDLEEVVQRIQERVSGGLGQSLDQEFGWAEAERPRRRVERGTALPPPGVGDGFHVYGSPPGGLRLLRQPGPRSGGGFPGGYPRPVPTPHDADPGAIPGRDALLQRRRV
jgi:serine/threonine-protein kinase